MAEYIAGQAAEVMRGRIEENADGSLKAPKSIILTATGARSIYRRLEVENLKRELRYAAIDGLLAGRPPYDQDALISAKLDYVANVNMLDARSLYERGAQAYWNLNYQAQTVARIKYITGSPEDIDIEDTLSQNFHDILFEWPSFIPIQGFNAGQLIKYGLSTIIWPNQKSWKWRVIDISSFFVPDQTQCDLEQLGCTCVTTDLTVQYLFQIYEAFKGLPQDDNQPWNIDELVYLLITLANSTDKSATGSIHIADLQRRFYDGDITLASVLSDSVKLVSFYQKEYDGTVTHYMFHPLYSKDTQNFLYKFKSQYKSFNDLLLIFTSNPGEKTLHGNLGLGHKLYTSSQAIMRLDNSVLDMARLASTPILTGGASGSADPSIIRFYPGVPTLVGQMQMAQNNYGANINQVVGASQYFLGKQSFNLGNSGDDPAQPDKSAGSISAEQFKFDAVKELAILRQSIAHYYNTQDYLFQNVVARMLQAQKGDPDFEYVEEWKDRCIQDNQNCEQIFKLTKKGKVGVLPKNWKVKATRVTGDGSALAALLSLEAFAKLAGGSMTPKGIAEFNKQVAIATVGPDHVNSFLEPEADESKGNGASIAGAENGLMRLGEAPVLSINDRHRTHYGIHAALAMKVIDMLQQQLKFPETGQTMDPVAADKIFSLVIPHMKEHLDEESKSLFGKTWVEQQMPGFKQMFNYSQENRGNAEKILESNLKKQTEDVQQTQTVMTDAERKDFQATADEKRKDFTLQSKEQRTAQAQEVRGETMQRKVVLDADNKQLDILLKNKIEAEKASAEVLREDIKARNGQTPSPGDIEIPRPSK